MTIFMEVVFLALVAAAIFGLIRVFVGPHHLDRVLALDYLSIVGIAIVILMVLITGEAMLLDVGVCLALVGFVTAYVFAKFVPKEQE